MLHIGVGVGVVLGTDGCGLAMCVAVGLADISCWLQPLLCKTCIGCVCIDHVLCVLADCIGYGGS